MSASKLRREKIFDILFTLGYTYPECKRIYSRLYDLKSRNGKAFLRLNTNISSLYSQRKQGEVREYPV